MKQINLLPLRQRERLSYRRGLAFETLGAVLALLFLFSFWLWLNQLTDLQQKQYDRLQALETQLTRTQLSVATQPAESADLIQRINALNTLSKTEVNWSQALAKLGDIIPQDIQLNSYSFAGSGSALTLKFAGQAPSTYSFAVFSQALTSTPILTKAKVDSYSYLPEKGTVTFSVSASMPFTQVSYTP